MSSDVALTVAIPTYLRPHLLARALESLARQSADSRARTELVVSDNSTDDSSASLYHDMEQAWLGPHRYVRNFDSPGMVGNFNRCVERAEGRYVLILHDDDYLLPGGLDDIHSAIEQAPNRSAFLFGVRVVNAAGRTLRRQHFRRDRYLEPKVALKKVLEHSSYVRFPAIVVRRDAYREVGQYDASRAGACDFHMWVRLFARFGVQTMASTTAAYVVHEHADTNGVFTHPTIEHTLETFEEARAARLLPEATIARCQAAWFHQFILAGAVRRLRAGDVVGAKEILGLFALPEVKAAGPSLRWLPSRLAVRALTVMGASWALPSAAQDR